MNENFQENKIVPIGGCHKSASSMLAQAMNDKSILRVVCYGFTADGSIKPFQYGATIGDMALVSVLAAKSSTDHMIELPT